MAGSVALGSEGSAGEGDEDTFIQLMGLSLIFGIMSFLTGE